jgi:hypothetical protein
MDLEGLTINGAQRALVGFALEPALERMIEWLSEAYGVAINAVVLKYIRTANGAEILTRSAVISEEEDKARTAGRKFKIPMSDEPGTYRYVPGGSATWGTWTVRRGHGQHDEKAEAAGVQVGPLGLGGSRRSAAGSTAGGGLPHGVGLTGAVARRPRKLRTRSDSPTFSEL